MAEEEIQQNDGSAKVTLEDVYKMFYILIRQAQELQPGVKLSFPLGVFKTLPKQIKVNFQQKSGRLFAWIPEKRNRQPKKKSKLALPSHEIITPN